MGLAWWLVGLIAFITVVGIPWGIQHLKLAGITISPIGKAIVTKEVAKAALQANAQAKVMQMRGNT